ncbi:MAG: Gfo/Idh/MocA family oxidoreductase [Rhodothermales bacterium]
MNQKTRTSRRTFLKAAGAVAAGLPLVSAQSYARIIGANERMNVGIIGCGGMAANHLNALLNMPEAVEVVAVNDVYETRARHFQDIIFEEGGRAIRESDYRGLLDRDDLDYVLIASPEHWHARQTIDALDAGLHVYCEKPMTHTVEESFEVLEKVRSSGLKMQVGVQGMSDDSYESAHAAIRDGRIGPVIAAQIEYVRNYDDVGPWRTGVDPELPKPDDLDWEAWLGPAPDRPWSPRRYFEWRIFRDYSGGVATDLFIHRLTRLLKACELGIPDRVVGMGGIYLWDDGRELPDNMEMLLEYPAVEGVTPGMTVHVLGTMGNGRRIEHVIRGHGRSLVFTGEGWEIVDESTGEVLERHEKTGAESVFPHHQNLQSAIRDDAPLRCDAELGLYGVVAVAGAVESWFEKKMLNWDARRNRWA